MSSPDYIRGMRAALAIADELPTAHAFNVAERVRAAINATLRESASADEVLARDTISKTEPVTPAILCFKWEPLGCKPRNAKCGWRVETNCGLIAVTLFGDGRVHTKHRMDAVASRYAAL